MPPLIKYPVIQILITFLLFVHWTIIDLQLISDGVDTKLMLLKVSSNWRWRNGDTLTTLAEDSAQECTEDDSNVDERNNPIFHHQGMVAQELFTLSPPRSNWSMPPWKRLNILWISVLLQSTIISFRGGDTFEYFILYSIKDEHAILNFLNFLILVRN